MKMLLNGRELDGFLDQELTLGGALRRVQEQAIPPQQVIASVWVDGAALSAEHLAQWKDRPIREFAETHVQAADRKALAINGLQLLAEGLEQSASLRAEISEQLWQGKTAQAMDKLGGYLQIWNGTQASLGSVARLLEVEPGEIKLDDAEPARTSSALIDKLTSQLQELHSALSAGDFVLLGDILAYEFGPLTEDWTGMLREISRKQA